VEFSKILGFTEEEAFIGNIREIEERDTNCNQDMEYRRG